MSDEARKARAQRLRLQIKELSEGVARPRELAESPAEFVHRRMAELNRKGNEAQDSEGKRKET